MELRDIVYGHYMRLFTPQSDDVKLYVLREEEAARRLALVDDLTKTTEEFETMPWIYGKKGTTKWERLANRIEKRKRDLYETPPPLSISLRCVNSQIHAEMDAHIIRSAVICFEMRRFGHFNEREMDLLRNAYHIRVTLRLDNHGAEDDDHVGPCTWKSQLSQALEGRTNLHALTFEGMHEYHLEEVHNMLMWREPLGERLMREMIDNTRSLPRLPSSVVKTIYWRDQYELVGAEQEVVIEFWRALGGFTRSR